MAKIDFEKKLSKNLMPKWRKNTTICPDGGKSAPNDKLSVEGTVLKIQWKLIQILKARKILPIALYSIFFRLDASFMMKNCDEVEI